MDLDHLMEFRSSPAMRDKLREYGIVKTFERGAVVLDENAYIRSIPIVLRGSIRVLRTEPDGREILLYYINTGESCVMSFLGGLHRGTSKIRAVADEDAEILFIPMDKVPVLIREHPEWLEYIFKLYHKRFEELLQVINDVAFKRMDERLLDLVRKKSEQAGSKTLRVTHEQLAGELGTSRVVVSRLLKQMESRGLVKLGRNNIALV